MNRLVVGTKSTNTNTGLLVSVCISTCSPSSNPSQTVLCILRDFWDQKSHLYPLLTLKCFLDFLTSLTLSCLLKISIHLKKKGFYLIFGIMLIKLRNRMKWSLFHRRHLPFPVLIGRKMLTIFSSFHGQKLGQVDIGRWKL